MRFLVTLDSLFDLRLAAILQLIEKMEHEDIPVSKYQYRIHDYWSHLNLPFDKNDVDKIMSNDTGELFAKTHITGMVQLLREYSTHKPNALFMGTDYGLELTVVSHQYEFGDKVKKALNDKFAEVLNLKKPVEFIRMEKSTWFPWYINNYDCFVCYDYSSWFTEHAEELARKPIPNVDMLAPALLVDPRHIHHTPEMADVQFQEFERTMIPFININFQPAAIFNSILLNTVKEE